MGRVCDRVYDTGRDLLNAGVIEGGDMLPEAALVKLMWVLGNETDKEKAAAMMQTDLKGECSTEEQHMDYNTLGLIAGIEIHQQLDTKEKLFCHCPTLLREIADHERRVLPVPAGNRERDGRDRPGSTGRDET